MAGSNYVTCGECGKRLFYDGDFCARESMKDRGETATVTCDHCVSKLKKKVGKLMQHDRRRH